MTRPCSRFHGWRGTRTPTPCGGQLLRLPRLPFRQPPDARFSGLSRPRVSRSMLRRRTVSPQQPTTFPPRHHPRRPGTADRHSGGASCLPQHPAVDIGPPGFEPGCVANRRTGGQPRTMSWPFHFIATAGLEPAFSGLLHQPSGGLPLPTSLPPCTLRCSRSRVRLVHSPRTVCLHLV